MEKVNKKFQNDSISNFEEKHQNVCLYMSVLNITLLEKSFI